MFIWNLLFYLFKCIASNENEEIFALSKFTFFSLKRIKLCLSFDWDRSSSPVADPRGGGRPPYRRTEGRFIYLFLIKTKTTSFWS